MHAFREFEMHARFHELVVGKTYDFNMVLNLDGYVTNRKMPSLPRQGFSRGTLKLKGDMYLTFEDYRGGMVVRFTFTPLQFPGLALTEVDAGQFTHVA